MLSFITSCAEIKVYTPSSKFTSPEAAGKLFAGNASIGLDRGTEGIVSLENDRTDNPLEMNNDNSQLMTSFDLGLMEKLDVFTKVTFGSPTLVGLKYQVYGEARENAGKGNTSVSITYAGGGSGESASGSSIFFDSDVNQYDLSHRANDFSIIVGHRFEEDTLTYVTLSRTSNIVNISLEADSAPLNGADFEISSVTNGLNLGLVRYWRKMYVNIEGAIQENEWSNTDKITYGLINISLGIKWD